MTNDQFVTAIDAVITDFESRPAKVRGRRVILQMRSDQIKGIIQKGYSISEICGAIKAKGVSVSPALIRQVIKNSELSQEEKKPRKRRKSTETLAGKPDMVDETENDIIENDYQIGDDDPINFCRAEEAG